MLTNEHLLQAFEAAGASSGVVYVSVPITSGLREIALLDELGVPSSELRQQFRDRWRREVVEPNERDALEHAGQARVANPGLLVVDPSRLTVMGWEQDDYNGFWIKLMERHAVRVVAVPGWEFSRGARGEVSLGIALGHPVTDEAGTVLDRTDLEAIDVAAREKLIAQGWAQSKVDAYLPQMSYDRRLPLPSSPASETFGWLIRERAYQVGKFGTALDDDHTRAGLGEEGWWWRQLTSYFHRSRVLTLDTAVGRQALAKFVATGCGLLESAVRLYGSLPSPGVPSGTVEAERAEKL